MNFHNKEPKSRRIFMRFLSGVMFLFFVFSFSFIAKGQYDTYFLTVDPYSNNGCIEFGSQEVSRVHQINDFIGVTTSPPPVLATFTGGRKVGSYFQSCMGMTGYATARNDKYGRLTNLPNTIDINFHKSVKFKRIDIDGKFPQRVKVTIDGGASVEVDLNDETPGDGYGHKAVFVHHIFGDSTPRQFSNIKVSSDDPNWRFGVYSIDYFDPTPLNTPPPTPDYCNVTPIERPSPQNISSHDWTMNTEVTDQDGLVLSNIHLKGRMMAERISVPYYVLGTSQLTQRGELRPGDTGGALRSRLVSYKAEINDERLIVEAVYAIDNISSAQSCLTITQRYEFLREGLYGFCTPESPYPLNSATCSRWRALVSYEFKGNNGETLQSLNVAQRNHFKVNGYNKNSVGLFKDCDTGLPIGCLSSLTDGGGLIFRKKLNPLFSETYAPVIINGKETKRWDNLHQTYLASVSEPLDNILSSDFTAAGCPECVHSHWRWGKSFGEHFGNGEPFLPVNSNQDQSIGIVKFHQGEEHPNNLLDLFSSSNPESIRSRGSYEELLRRDHFNYSVPEEVVYWISAVGRKTSDEFFGYYSFFIPSEADIDRPITPDSLLTGLKQENLNSLTGQDVPTSINYGFLYTDGATRYNERDPDTIAQLPNGYAHYNSIAYDVRTEAAVSGPHTISFNLPSVTDQATFDSLRVLHSEPDPFDPTRAVWVDRTILSPDLPAPDYASRNISAKVNEVGPFVIVRLVNPPAPNTNVADLSLTLTESADPVTAGNDLVYTINVTNNGPNTATGVALSNGLSPDINFVSADAGQRFCNHINGTVVCNLDTIASGATIPITVTVKPNEGQTRFPAEGKSVVNTVFVTGNESDPDENNNSVSESTLAMPNPNAPPTVEIQVPVSEMIITGPANFNSVIKAVDSDGTISNVELFEDGQSVGSCVNLAPGSPYCTISRNSVPFGEHTLIAVTTDNGGRKAVSDAVGYFVNGPATINLTAPAENTLYGRPANITLTAIAANQMGSIAQVEFFANGESIGIRTSPTNGNQYDFVWNNAPTGTHLIRAVATEGNGIKSYSYSSKIAVTDAPTISITSPVTGVSYPKPATINFTAEARDFDGYVGKVEFFANGTSLIGEGTLTQSYSYTFTWSNVPAGTHTITAVATDGSGKTSVSSPVIVTVTNNAPTVSLTNPSNGAVFPPLATVNLSADASDSDGAISMVEFFNGSTLLGQSYYPPYNFTWDNAIAGTHNLTAKATDDDGATTVSAPVIITVNAVGNALLVVGNTTLSAVDTAINTRLQNLGLNVVIKSASSATSADANGKLVVIISDSVSPTSVNTKFKTVAVPVITLDPQLFDDMGMTPTASGNFGTTSSQKNITITNAGHPMAAGLSGTVQVTTANTTFGWGKPNANAAKVATLTSDATKATIFGYETGTAMPGLTAPARRVGFFYTASSKSLTTDGESLFDAAISWAAGF